MILRVVRAVKQIAWRECCPCGPLVCAVWGTLQSQVSLATCKGTASRRHHLRLGMLAAAARQDEGPMTKSAVWACPAC